MTPGLERQISEPQAPLVEPVIRLDRSWTNTPRVPSGLNDEPSPFSRDSTERLARNYLLRLLPEIHAFRKRVAVRETIGCWKETPESIVA